ncbi:hypothetical protein ACH5RR_012431 [Cinchona calisaya]|uniref:Uncharacterized protein n=1 Tax=Cinchona calisaya TaxID=153742 RepID=A0ABD3ABC8_9GENT
MAVIISKIDEENRSLAAAKTPTIISTAVQEMINPATGTQILISGADATSGAAIRRAVDQEIVVNAAAMDSKNQGFTDTDIEEHNTLFARAGKDASAAAVVHDGRSKLVSIAETTTATVRVDDEINVVRVRVLGAESSDVTALKITVDVVAFLDHTVDTNASQEVFVNAVASEIPDDNVAVPQPIE